MYVPGLAPVYVASPAPTFSPESAQQLANAKILGILGSAFLLVSFLPSVGGLLIPGAILVAFALKRISQAVSDRSIFDNAVYAALVAVLGAAVGVVLVLASLFALIGLSDPRTFDWANWTPSGGQVAGLAVTAVLGLVVVWAAFLVSAVYLKRSLEAVAVKLSRPEFRTAGTAYFVGAALTVVLVGFVIIAISALLLLVAFWAIPDPVVVAPPAPVPAAFPPPLYPPVA